jgi:hypothetical protein
MVPGLVLSRVYQPEQSIPDPETTITAKEAGNISAKLQKFGEK